MSEKHPIVAITGSSGAGTTNAKIAFERIFRQLGISATIIEGDGFHRYDRQHMDNIVAKAETEGRNVTHFGPEGNFAAQGSLTPWEAIPENTDLLFYEGLHGGIVTDTVNVAQHVDLLIGLVPIINLEWIQKIHRDQTVRGYSQEDATKMVLGRMYDYTHYITPQFSRTDINFQRVPTVDTSNPFAATEIPTNDQSFSVIHIRNLKKIKVDFRGLLKMLEGSFMSTPDTIVVPAGKKIFAMQLILTPLIQELIQEK